MEQKPAIRDLKASVDFRDLVRETRSVDAAGKIHCPHHDDATPSYHVYADHGYCFACHAFDDHISWLEHQHGLSTPAAVAYLRATAAPGTPPRVTNTPIPRSAFRPIAPRQLDTHLARARRLAAVPAALRGRGFTLPDLKNLTVAAENDDAIFPITGPTGSILALKRRFARARPHRYQYLTPGCGTPAWCSPGLAAASSVLVIEGELNAMAAWLAVKGSKRRVGVMGPAGATAPLHPDALAGKTVYVHADKDDAGDRARARWAEDARAAGAHRVLILDPWPLDACEVAGRFGRNALRVSLTWTRAVPYAPRATNASTAAPNPAPSPTRDLDSMQSPRGPTTRRPGRS